ncbi:MAG: histidine kinase dimerization/phospho-acceptor domain-containing protein, partial [Gemmatimonadales bacterium]
MDQRRIHRRTLPSQRTLLAWLFSVRVLLAIAGVLGASTIWVENPDTAFIIMVAVFVAFTVTAYGYWFVWIRNQPPGPVFLFLQGTVDLGLVTTIVHFTGGSQSGFSAIYVLVIATYTTLMSFRAGLAFAALAGVTYLLDAMAHTGPIGIAFWGQIAVFAAVFGVVALMISRLREVSEEQESLQTELMRVRLEADDILRNIRSGVLTVNGEGRLAYMNPMAARLLQLDGDALTGYPVLEDLKHRSTELWAAIVSGIRTGRKINRGEGMVLLEDERLFPIGLSTTTFEEDSGQSPSVTAIFTDISDSKRLQELHLRAERLEAVAALSASLAHEIRNPLASIRSSVEQLARSARADDDERFLAQLIVRESDRLSRLLSEFLDFARVRATHFDPVDLHAVAAAASRLVREHPETGADTVVEVQGGRTSMDGDEDLLHRIVVNLLLNA